MGKIKTRPFSCHSRQVFSLLMTVGTQKRAVQCVCRQILCCQEQSESSGPTVSGLSSSSWAERRLREASVALCTDVVSRSRGQRVKAIPPLDSEYIQPSWI